MTSHYAVHIEGSREPSSTTPAATGADFDQALADPRQRSADRNHVVRYNGPEGSRIICTLVQGEVLWPRLTTPVVDLEAGQ